MNKDDATFWLKRHPLLVVSATFFVADVILLFVVLSAHHTMRRVSFLDVGQGDAVLIEAPNGNQLLYDAGPPSGASLRALAREMAFWDRSIDIVVFSHPDMDHIGAFPEIFKRYKIGAVLEPGATAQNGVYEETQLAIADENAAHMLARKGMTIELGGGVFVDVLYPDHDMSGEETNSASVVLRVRYGSTAFLVSGDLPQAQEEYVAREFGNSLPAQVLKIGH